MTDYRCMFSTSDRHRKLNQLRWQNTSGHLTNETSNWLQQLPMHLNWALYNVSDLYIDPHICFFPDLVTGSVSAKPVSTARGLSAAQREACMRSLTTQKPKRLPRVVSVRLVYCWSLRCSWSITCRRCSNYIFILNLTPDFNGLGKDNYKMRREAFKFWDWARLILETLRYITLEITGTIILVPYLDVKSLQPIWNSATHDDVIKWKHFCVTGPLCGEFTSHRWIPRIKASDAELWCFLWSAPE